MHIRLACVTTRAQEDRMLPWIGKNVVVIGGSRGVGRRIVEAAIRNGARVLAVARREAPLRQLAKRFAAPKFCRSTQRMKRLLPKYSRSCEWDSWYHGYYEGKGTPQGASYLYWVDSKRDSAAFESFLGAMPGALSCGWERTRIRLLMIRMAGNHISSGAGARRLLM